MIELTNFRLITGTDTKPIVVVVDAGTTSTTITWEYVCEYKEQGCRTVEVTGTESQTVNISDICSSSYDSCNGCTCESTIAWKGLSVNYQIVVNPNTTYNPRTEYKVTSVNGSSVNNGVVNFLDALGCGEGREAVVPYTYQILTYNNECSTSPDTVVESSGETSIILDCTDHSDESGKVSAYTTIEDTDIVYTYSCGKCSGASCVANIKIDTVKLLSMKVNGVNSDSVPCSGASNITCNVSYRKTEVSETCDKKISSLMKTITGLSIPPCSGDKCCRKHNVPLEIVIEGKPFTIDVIMKRDKDGSCNIDCKDSCESALTASLLDWQLNYNGKTYKESTIQNLPKIPRKGDTFTIQYKLEVTKLDSDTDCEEEVFEVINDEDMSFSSADCANQIIDVIYSGINKDGCIPSNPKFTCREIPEEDEDDTSPEEFVIEVEIQSYKYNGQTYYLQTPYPKILIPYKMNHCKE